jgi:hypothetical protein
VRIITPVPPGEAMAVADARLADFTRRAVAQLPGFVPN